MYKTVLGIIALASAGAAANAANTISLGGSNVNWGNTHDFTLDGQTVRASGFSAPYTPTALFGKNGGGDEIGLGLANDPSHDNEIYYGYGFVQLDVHNLFNLINGLAFTTNSTTQGEQWSVFGSNTAGAYSGLAVLTGTNESGGVLPISPVGYRYYDFVSTSQSGGKNFLISTLTALPEPSTWGMMLLGFGAIGFAMRRRPRNVLAQVA
jgi:hypothetical protein